jgi:hypothetical protein
MSLEVNDDILREFDFIINIKEDITPIKKACNEV